MAPKKYTIMAEIGSGILLPATKNYSIKIACGEHSWEFKKIKKDKD